MLTTMNSELRKQFENVRFPIEIITVLKAMFQESNVRKATSDVLRVQKRKGFEKSEKGKGKVGDVQVENSEKPEPCSRPVKGPTETDLCHFCKRQGHWKRNCKEFRKGLKNLKKSFETTSKGIYVIEVNVTSTDSNSSVLDTGCGAYIPNVNDLKSKNELKKGQVMLRAGNEAKVAALAVGTDHLSLAS